MNRIIFNFFIATILITCLASCDEETAVFNDSTAFFQHEYRNSAWGISHSGWFIDREGNVRFYNLPIGWNEPDSEGYLTEEELQSNLQSADSILYKVPFIHLTQMVDLIDDIDESRLHQQDSHTNDAGTATLYFYYHDLESDRYKRVLIWSRGDFMQTNVDPDATNLIAYLFSVGLKAGYFIQF